MSYEESLRSISLDADASLAVYTGVPGTPGSADPNYGKMYRFVKVTGPHAAGLVDDAGGDAIGVLQNKPQVTGQAATIAISGVSNVLSGDVIVAGDEISADANGCGIKKPTSGSPVVLGVALVGTAATGQLFPMLLRVN